MQHAIATIGGQEPEKAQSPVKRETFWRKFGKQRFSAKQQEAILNFAPRKKSGEELQTRERLKPGVLVMGDAFRSFRHFARFKSRRLRGLDRALEYAAEADDGGACMERDGRDVYRRKERSRSVVYQSDGTPVIEAAEEVPISVPATRNIDTVRDAFYKE
jgi:hypothetical protein